jgi:hypothetical protein
MVFLIHDLRFTINNPSINKMSTGDNLGSTGRRSWFQRDKIARNHARLPYLFR